MHGSFIQQTSHRFDALSAHREQTLYCWHWTTMYGIYTKSTRPVVHTTKSSIINQVQMGFATFSNSICIIRRVLFLLPFLVSLIILWWIYLKNTFFTGLVLGQHLHLSLVFLLYRAISNLHRKPPASDLSKVGG